MLYCTFHAYTISGFIIVVKIYAEIESRALSVQRAEKKTKNINAEYVWALKWIAWFMMMRDEAVW